MPEYLSTQQICSYQYMTVNPRLKDHPTNAKAFANNTSTIRTERAERLMAILETSSMTAK